MKKLDKMDEEFENFMYKVNEVNNIVHKLSSQDKKIQEIGDLEAKQYLGESEIARAEKINEDDIVLNVRSNRTVINRKALQQNDDDPNTKSQEAFMAEVSKDADKRHKDKLIRIERMETFKKQATLAFRRNEFEKALCLYTKAIEQIKDSCLLYNNRALTYIKLKLYDKALDDLKWALRLNEDCLKSLLLSAKAHYCNNNFDGYKKAIDEAKERHLERISFIEEYVVKMKKENDNCEP